ncbi:MAG: glycosyltransferase [Sphingobacteriaceae bacterium]|nr:glycosyltransferase [Sphingobacteriaceae bacterium]
MLKLFLVIFCLSVFAILHTYVFYPLLIIFFASFKKRVPSINKNSDLPEVCVLIAAYNEEKVIGQKIQSIVEGDYPLEKIRVLIGSDASTDDTNQIIQNWKSKYSCVELIEFGGRTGKAGIINKLAELAGKKILILTDANVIFAKDTLGHLLMHFNNEQVAQVCANIIKVADSKVGIAGAEKSYLALENKIKYSESLLFGIVMGAEGACYAIRSEFYNPVPPKFFMDDFYMTMNVIEQGGKIVFAKEAICFEDVPDKSSEEFKRKIRISIGNFQNLFRFKKLLWPPWSGVSFAFLSHKLLRWKTPFLILTALKVSILLSFYFPLFQILLILQCIGILSPLLDKLTLSKIFFIRYLSHFYMMNAALLIGFFKFLKGVDTNIWTPTERNV